MQELNKVFEEYMEEYKQLSIEDKRKEIIKSIKELIAVFEKLAIDDNIKLHYLKNREINDLKNKVVSEDDFLEAEFVYLEVAKNLIGEYLLSKNV